MMNDLSREEAVQINRKLLKDPESKEVTDEDVGRAIAYFYANKVVQEDTEISMFRLE
mgnify:CR=1 FL=1